MKTVRAEIVFARPAFANYFLSVVIRGVDTEYAMEIVAEAPSGIVSRKSMSDSTPYYYDFDV